METNDHEWLSYMKRFHLFRNTLTTVDQLYKIVKRETTDEIKTNCDKMFKETQGYIDTQVVPSLKQILDNRFKELNLETFATKSDVLDMKNFDLKPVHFNTIKKVLFPDINSNISTLLENAEHKLKLVSTDYTDRQVEKIISDCNRKLDEFQLSSKNISSDVLKYIGNNIEKVFIQYKNESNCQINKINSVLEQTKCKFPIHIQDIDSSVIDTITGKIKIGRAHV